MVARWTPVLLVLISISCFSREYINHVQISICFKRPSWHCCVSKSTNNLTFYILHSSVVDLSPQKLNLKKKKPGPRTREWQYKYFFEWLRIVCIRNLFEWTQMPQEIAATGRWDFFALSDQVHVSLPYEVHWVDPYRVKVKGTGRGQKERQR